MVFDSFALIALFQDEPGAARVAELIDGATVEAPLHMSEVNFAEVKYTIIRKKGPDRWTAVAAEIATLPLRLHAATHAQAERVGELKAAYKLSLADAFAVALAEELGAEIVTGDPEIRDLGSLVRVDWVGPAR